MTPGGSGARGAGRHPDADRVVVRLTQPAVDDLQTLLRKGDPQVVKWALKKMLLLERDPEAGAPLLGGLIGWRKLTVGDRGWRVVWRVTHDNSGTAARTVVVDVAEVWAVGARSDGEVYDEMTSRVAVLGDSPETSALADVIALLGKHAATAQATPGPEAGPRTPPWLRDCLIHVVKLPEADVDALTPDQAQARWDAYTTGNG